MKLVRVLLADDHQLVRAGFRSLLQQHAWIEVVAEAASGHEALRLIAEHRPDIVMMDVAMPGLNGLEATARVKKDHPRTRVLIVSMTASEEHVLQALRAGAAGYLLKTANSDELALALQTVARGEPYLSSAVSQPVIDAYVRRVGGAGTPLERLTPRQREVLQLVAEGRSTKEIAVELDISIKTAETHRAQLMEALDIHDTAGLVRFAIRAGLVSADS